MQTYTVMLKPGERTTDVDGFPAAAARSTKGSLPLLAGTSRTVTQDELQHINKLGIKVDVLGVQNVSQPSTPAAIAKTLEEVKAEVAAKKSAAK